MGTSLGAPAQSRPVRADAKRNYDRILAAAEVAFREHGPSASMDEIARKAGVGAGTLYRHFPSRDDLLLAFFEIQVDELRKLAESLLTHPRPGEALAQWLRAKLLHALTYRGLSAEVMNTLIDRRPDLSGSCSLMRDASVAVFERARAAGEIRTDIDYGDLMKMTNAIALAAEKTPEGNAQAKRLLEFAMDGLQIRREPAAPGR